MVGRPKGVRDSTSRNPYKQRVIKGSTDGESYGCIGSGNVDSGCAEATAKLGEPSCCLKNCPFPECLLDHLKGVGRPKGRRKCKCL